MLSPTTIWIAFALYMCFLLGVAVYVTVQDKKKAAGGSLLTASVKWPVLVMTYIASLMSTWGILRRYPARTTAAVSATGSAR